jgi:hypothetical protein
MIQIILDRAQFNILLDKLLQSNNCIRTVSVEKVNGIPLSHFLTKSQNLITKFLEVDPVRHLKTRTPIGVRQI